MFVKYLAITSLLLYSCTDTGIFSTIALSQKIEKGTLPKNISSFRIFNLPEAKDEKTREYYFLHAGTGIYYKNATRNNKWSSSPISLYSEDGGNWTGIQSIVATKDRIFMVVYRYDGTNYSLGMQTLDSFNGSKPSYTFFNKTWENTSKSYQVIHLFVPYPGTGIYVNILEYDGKYASLEPYKNNFKLSKLYTLNPDTRTWNPDESFNQKNLVGHFVTGIAAKNENLILISAVKKRLGSSTGVLLDKDGNIVEPSGDLKANTPLDGLKWLKRSWSTSGGAFIASATKKIGSTFPIYASKDGKIWTRIPGSSSSYKVSSFVDISNTVAGKNDSARLALAGTYSHISSGAPTIPYGYNEINIISDKLGEWKVTTSRNSYQFANLSNYASTRLPRASINGLQILESDGKKYLFALTSFKGLWSVPLDSRRPYWKEE